MRFMVQWASSSAATSPDPRSLFHSSVPEHSTTPDRGNISFSSRTPLVPALRRNRSSNASSSPPLVTGTPGASASGAATATPPVGKSASANARSATAAPLLSASHSFSSRGDDERLPARTRADPSAAAVAAAPCPHAAPGWGMPCSACLRRALEGGGAVPRSSSAEGRVQQRPAGAEEAGNGARAPEGKAGGRRGEGEGESESNGAGREPFRGMGRVGVGEGRLGKGEGESGGMGESRMGDERAVGGGEDGGREEGEVGSGKRGSGEEGDGDERGGGEDHGGKRERGEGKRLGQEKDPGGGGEKQRRENGMVGGGEEGGQTGEEEDGEEEEGEKGNGEEEDETWAWATEAWVWAWAWGEAWGEGWEGRVACRRGSSSGPSLVGLGGRGGTRPSMATPTASRGGSAALSGSSGYS
ncbi:unnamed protein product [Closterium sp. Naga37s-1]|nr:unnamed protein product [Closterium sp. Naga37s-1]